jgi:AraC-like DNA-binding protein
MNLGDMNLGGTHLGRVKFPDAALVMASDDFDVIRHDVSRIFKPHLLHLRGPSADLHGHLHRLRLGATSLIRLEYGAEVEIDPDRLDDFFCVQIPVSGLASIWHGGRRFDSSARTASLISPTVPVHMRWHAGNAQVCLRFERYLVEQHCAAHLGHPLDRPLEFVPELRLDTDAGRYLLRLIRIFADEVIHTAQPDRTPLLANEHAAAQFSSVLLNALLYGQRSNVSDALERLSTSVAPRFVRRAEEYVRRHYAEALSIERIAVNSGVSARTLFSGFRDFRHITPMEYLRRIRLEKVREALQQGDISVIGGVQKIAVQCGFVHLGRFAAHYRLQYGEYPSETARMSLATPRTALKKKR